jgi:uncharacterized protein YegL
VAKTQTDAKKAAKAAAKDKKTGKVHLFILMDESGSMTGTEEAVVTGCNEFLHSFKDNKDARAWLGWFDCYPGEDRMRLKVKGKKVIDVKPLKVGDYNPRGTTPLNDAIMDSLKALDKAAGKDESVFMAIITDGLENASETSVEAVKDALGKREKKGWGFVYLGANQDAAGTAVGYGLTKKGQALNFRATASGVRATTRTASYLAQSYAHGGVATMDSALAATYDKTGGHIEEDDEDE